LDGVSGDPAINTTDAAQLGVQWMTPVGASLSSPVTAWNADLDETLAYVGTRSGDLDAVAVASGQLVWSVQLGSQIEATPVVDGSNLWVAPASTGRLLKLDADNGSVECGATVPTPPVQSSPVLATPPGGRPTVYLATDDGPTNGTVLAVNESDCTTDWTWGGWQSFPGAVIGSWSPVSYAVDAAGEPLVLLGSADPDGAEYALDAVTGAEVWRFGTYQQDGADWDVGSGAAVSAPGVNGLADGAVYFTGKDGFLYALDLSTGAPLWSFNFGGNGPGVPPVTTDALDTPALQGTTLVFGERGGVYAVNAVTGAVLWHTLTDAQADEDGSPLVAGAGGNRVVVFTSTDGTVQVFGLGKGTLLSSYATAADLAGSPAEVDGNLLVAGDDGFLYDFAPGGGHGSAPTTAVTWPPAGAGVPNPGANLTLRGTASAADGVRAVEVAVQQPAGTGDWYDRATASGIAGLALNQAHLASPGATSTTWSLVVPAPFQGGTMLVRAVAVGQNGVADPTPPTQASGPAVVTFTVAPGKGAARLTLGAARVAPGAWTTVKGSGFGPDEAVTLSLPAPSEGTATVLSVTTSSSGSFAKTALQIPTGTPFGLDTLAGVGAGSGRLAAAPVVVGNDAPQLAYGPAHVGFEPSDTVISRTQGLDDGNLVDPVWRVATPGGAGASPVEAGGLAVVGDSTGRVTAVTVATGKTAWTAQVPGAVGAPAAVDQGLVFVVDRTGTVTALAAASGTPAWSAVLGSAVTAAPTVAGGLLYVATTGGTLWALNETTGAAVWQAAAAGALSPVSVDTKAHLALAGDATGELWAWNSVTGAPAWQVATGAGALSAPPLLSGGVAYLGGAADTFGAWQESSGAARWTVPTAGPVTAGANLVAKQVVVGDGAGQIQVLDPGSGAVQATLGLDGPAVGLSSATGVTVVALAGGELEMFRSPTAFRTDWSWTGGGGSYAGPPVVLNGEILVAGANGLQAFAPPGRPIT
jgi:outer membrane protein assembly factor BamB